MARAIIVGACLLLVMVAPAVGLGADSAPAGQPNIVVFYIDDAGPHDGRLWNDPARTPAIHEHFIAHGTTFTNAISEDPLCCPARANLLTGLHTHGNGVVANDARLFDPSVHVGKALKQAGYATMFIGKYLNQNHLLTNPQWVNHGAGWTHLDAIYGPNGQFTNYTLHTKTGNIKYGNYHSTRMVAERAITRMRETPSTTPVFALLSIYNLHGPNTPMADFVDDPRCATMPPWNPPNYNEADVSDKPAMVQALPLLPDSDGWPMVRHCEEMLGVDWAVQQVTDELEAQGRLDNTLLIFTADNGKAWGAHRVTGKRMPYSTPVPLYMSWPARWGSAPRTITEHTSNIDLAPTFCAIGGCTLGPFTGGQPGPDGVNLLPLLDGDVANLGRDALLEAQLDPAGSGGGATGNVTWTGLRTTALNALGRWHYVEYSTGERELYNLATDPYELKNRAGQQAVASVQSLLADRLAELRAEGRMGPGGPDASLSVAAGGPFKGGNVYAAVPKKQTQTRSGLAQNRSYSFWLRIQNDSPVAETFTVLGASTGSDQISVTYLADGVDVTRQVAAGTYTLTDTASDHTVTMVIRMTVAAAPPDSRRRVIVRVTSVDDPTKVDVVRAVGVT